MKTSTRDGNKNISTQAEIKKKQFTLYLTSWFIDENYRLKKYHVILNFAVVITKYSEILN